MMWLLNWFQKALLFTLMNENLSSPNQGTPTKMGRLKAPSKFIPNNSNIKKSPLRPFQPNTTISESIKARRKAQLDKILKEFDAQVELRCKQIENEGDEMNLMLKQSMSVWKFQLPAKIRKMPLSEIVSRHNGSIKSALRSTESQNRLCQDESVKSPSGHLVENLMNPPKSRDVKAETMKKLKKKLDILENSFKI